MTMARGVQWAVAVLATGVTMAPLIGGPGTDQAGIDAPVMNQPGAGQPVADALGINPPVTVKLLDGSVMTGSLVDVSGQTLALRVEGATRQVAVDDVSEVAFSPAHRPVAGAGQCMLLLDGGGRLDGSLGTAAGDGVLLRSPRLGALTVPFERIAAVRWPVDGARSEADALWTERQSDRLASADVLITRGDHPKALRGTVLAIGPTLCRFLFNGSERGVRTEKVFGIVFADAGHGNRRKRNAVVRLDDGERLGCRIEQCGDAVLIADAGFAEAVRIPIEHIVRISFSSSRVVYLSDLPITTRRYTGIIHTSRPVRLDRNVANQPIRLGGRTYAKGIGMQSDSAVIFDLAEPYAFLAATIGVDDAVGSAGSVTFTVSLDGQVAYSKKMTGRDEPVSIVVPLEGAGRLSIGAGDGGDTDVSDWADWGAVRLVRPKSSS